MRNRDLFVNPELAKALPGLMLFGTLVGVCAGAVVHLLVARFGRRTPELRGVIVNCVAGSLAFLAGVAAVMFIPLPAHTEVEQVGGVIFRTTTQRFQHPYLVALALAVLVPAAIELIRSRLRRRQTV